MTTTKRYDSIDFTPPQTVADHAERGLRWREEHGRGGTDVGVKRARQLAARETLGPDDIKSMYSYFARHTVDKQADNFDNAHDPSAGRIAWELWGGDAGERWATRLHEAMQKADAQADQG